MSHLGIPAAARVSDGAERVGEALERTAKAVTMRPVLGQGTALTRVRLRRDLACDVEDGPHRFAVGMSAKYGGTEEAPTPGVYGRAAFGSCLAINYAMWAARLGVPIDSLEVEVQADYDARGELGVDEHVPPGYLELRYVVTVASPAPEADVRRVLDTGDRFSSWLDDFTRAVPVRREVRLAGAER